MLAGLFEIFDTKLSSENSAADFDDDSPPPDDVETKLLNGFQFKTDVDKPRRSEGMMPHILYRVRYWTTLPQYSSGHAVALRRYSDFVWLRTQLRQKYPGALVPPVPEKTMLSVDDPKHGVIVERTLLLKWFLHQVAVHPLLRESADLANFLDPNIREFQSWYDRGLVADMMGGASSVLSYGESLVSGSGGSMEAATTRLAEGQLQHSWPTPAEYCLEHQALIKYFTKFEECLSGLCSASARVADRHEEQARALFDLANGLTAAGSNEETDQHVVADWAGLPCTSLGPPVNWGLCGSHLRNYVIQPFKDQGPQINSHMYLALKKAQLLSQSAKEMILDREEVFKLRTVHFLDVQRKKSALERALSAPAAPASVSSSSPASPVTADPSSEGVEVLKAQQGLEIAERDMAAQQNKWLECAARTPVDLREFSSLCTALISPALKAFTQLQGRLSGHTSAAFAFLGEALVAVQAEGKTTSISEIPILSPQPPRAPINTETANPTATAAAATNPGITTSAAAAPFSVGTVPTHDSNLFPSHDLLGTSQTPVVTPSPPHMAVGSNRSEPTTQPSDAKSGKTSTAQNFGEDPFLPISSSSGSYAQSPVVGANSFHPTVQAEGQFVEPSLDGMENIDLL